MEPRGRLAVLGQGYVGLPLAREATLAGWQVLGFDRNPAVAEGLNSGRSHVDDLTDGDVALMVEQGYHASGQPGSLSGRDVYVICVPTPLQDLGPDLSAVEDAAALVGTHMTAGCLVVLESTTYPGTTEEVVRPILEARSGLTCGTDFHLAFSPERVNPGFPEYGIRNTPKLVGGVDADSTAAAIGFYSTFVETVVQMKGTREAEAAKLLENTFRHVNIALVNEMAMVCHELGIDIWDVIAGAETKPFGFMSFFPGPGVGGHCIPIDPNYLGYEVRRRLGYPFRFVELAREINNSMPRYVTSRIGELLNDHGTAISQSSILLLGVTYKANISDQRESPALLIADLLHRAGAKVMYHDPHVAQWRLAGRTLICVDDLGEAAGEADLVVLLQNHAGYDLDAVVERSRLFLDTRGVSHHPKTTRL